MNEGHDYKYPQKHLMLRWKNDIFSIWSENMMTLKLTCFMTAWLHLGESNLLFMRLFIMLSRAER